MNRFLVTTLLLGVSVGAFQNPFQNLYAAEKPAEKPANNASEKPFTPVLLAKAEALPLALSDDFEFRKVLTFEQGRRANAIIGGGGKPSTQIESIAFEEKFHNFGAVTEIDKREREGRYFDFSWRTGRPANLTVRLEYRQQNSGPYVQAQELRYENVSGNHRSQFEVVGDAYDWQGPVTSWRVVLVEDGKIVALHSSYLWN